MSTSEAGRKPRTPRSMIRPPLTTSMTWPSTGSPHSAAASVGRPAFPEPPPLLGGDEGAALLGQLDLVGGIHGLANRQLVGGDDALGLVADVHQHLVRVD